MPDIRLLLASVDANASLVQRHLWLINLIALVRGDGRSPQQAIARVEQVLTILETDSLIQVKFKAWWKKLSETVDLASLLAEFGFAPRAAFVSELAARFRRKLIPKTPETSDAAELFELAFSHPGDAAWLAALGQSTLERIGRLITLDSRVPGVTLWEHELLDAITYCASQIRAAGFSAELRLRMNSPALDARPFHDLAHDAQLFREAFMHQPAPCQRTAAANQTALQLRERLETCRQAAASVYTHLEQHGISVGLVFRLRQLRERIVRVRDLMDCLLSDSLRTNEASTQRLLVRLASQSREMSGIRSLISANTNLLASKVAERSAETGELYITRDRAQYRSMLLKAAGGGAVVALTTVVKFALLGVAGSVFWDGFLASTNYALSFIAIQLLHWTLATKQPAMTATAMAMKLKDMTPAGAVDEFVDEVTHLVRSQMAAVLGNLALVVPLVLLASGLMQWLAGSPMISQAKAQHVLHELSLAGPSLLYAVFTGVLLFLSSIIAGWTENWFVLNRLDSVVQFNPRITSFLGQQRAQRWARFWRSNISGFASNVSLALLLGLLPAFAIFFGVGIEVRHVTLSAGQLAAALGSLGIGALWSADFWWAAACIPLIGLANIGISFYCALRLAIAANNVNGIDRKRVRRAIFRRAWQHPLSFFWPPADAKISSPKGIETPP